MQKLNWDNDIQLPEERRKGVSQPTLFIQALQDDILTKDLAKGMSEKIPNLTYGEVNSDHWALWHTTKETNEIIKNWFQGVVLGGKSKI